MLIIFMYNMSIWGGSRGLGWWRWGRFRRQRRRRPSYRSGTTTMKSGLTWGSFLCIICLYGVVPGARDAADGHVFVASVAVVGRRGPKPSPWSRAWHGDHFYVQSWGSSCLKVLRSRYSSLAKKVLKILMRSSWKKGSALQISLLFALLFVTPIS